MAAIENHTIFGYGCDSRGCDTEIRGMEMSFFRGQDYYRKLAVSSGWTFWASRSLRVYCPSHGPKRGHSMAQIEVSA